MAKKLGAIVPKITMEEMAFAMTAGGAAHSLRMPISVEEKTKSFELDDTVYRLGETPMNKAAVAVFDAFDHDREKGRAALYRCVMIMSEVMQHPSSSAWVKSDPNDPDAIEVHEALVEAVATIPTRWGQSVRPERVFRLATKIRDREEGGQ